VCAASEQSLVGDPYTCPLSFIPHGWVREGDPKVLKGGTSYKRGKGRHPLLLLRRRTKGEAPTFEVEDQLGGPITRGGGSTMCFTLSEAMKRRFPAKVQSEREKGEPPLRVENCVKI